MVPNEAADTIMRIVPRRAEGSGTDIGWQDNEHFSGNSAEFTAIY
jgi:hypothetical protein